MRFFIFLLLLTFSMVTSAQSAICELEETPRSARLYSTYKIKFPDGRWLMVIGHAHGFREVARKLFELDTDAPVYNRQIRQILSVNHPQILRDLKEDLDFARTAIDNGARFIGVEAAPDTLQDWKYQTRELYQKMISYGKRTGNIDRQLIHDATLTALGAPVYLALHERKILGSTQVIGLESSDSVTNDAVEYRDYKNDYAALVDLAQDDEIFKSKVLKTLDTELMLKTYPTYEPNDPFFQQRLINELLAKTPTKYHQAMLLFIDSAVAYMEALNRRDTYSATKMVGRNQSGIFFVGAIHAPAVAKKIREFCLASLPALPRTVQTESASANITR